jgi:hypothetical protein
MDFLEEGFVIVDQVPDGEDAIGEPTDPSVLRNIDLEIVSRRQLLQPAQ